jgi:phosphoribosylamine-glycine ligase
VVSEILRGYKPLISPQETPFSSGGNDNVRKEKIKINAAGAHAINFDVSKCWQRDIWSVIQVSPIIQIILCRACRDKDKLFQSCRTGF